MFVHSVHTPMARFDVLMKELRTRVVYLTIILRLGQRFEPSMDSVAY